MQAAWAEFRKDLGAALGAWAKAPALPLLAVAVGLTMTALRLPLYFLIWVAFVGWFGTERIWYLRVFRGKSITAREVVSFSFRFIGPFVGLGLIGVLVAIPLFGLAVLATLGAGPEWALPLIYIPLDALFTFMTPALAFTTRRPGEAFSIGINMLHEEWPRCLWYALVPPLAALAFIQTIPETGSRVALSAVAILLNLWFKGATAAFYLRRHEVGDDGSFTNELQPVEGGAEHL